MSSEPRMRVRQVHRSELRSASPVRSASPGGSHRFRFFEYAPSGEETAVYRGAKRFAFRRAKLRVRSLLAPLLPAGFPGTVTSDYLPFQLWDSCQGLCSYIRGSFTTAALLRGVGVGSAEATALHATWVYTVREWCGHAFGLLFAVAAAGKLDAEAKQWRFAADCANGVSYVLELLAPTLPRALFLPVVCAAAMLRAFTGVAAGATRAALTAHFARAHNIADVSAKEGSQETAVTLLGMLLGFFFVRYTEQKGRAVQWGLFLFISALHLFANAKAMRSLRLTSLNRERLALLAWHYEFSNQEVLSVAQVSQRERLLPQGFTSWMSTQRPRVPHIRLGVPLAELLAANNVNPAEFAPSERERRPLYFWRMLNDDRWTVYFAFHRRATSFDLAGAFVHAVSAGARGKRGNEKDFIAALAHPRIDWGHFSGLLHAKGWNMGRIHMSNDEGWRFDVR